MAKAILKKPTGKAAIAARRKDNMPKRTPMPAVKPTRKKKAVAKVAPVAPVKLDLKTEAGRQARADAILRLHQQGLINSDIAGKMQCEPRLVAKVIREAAEDTFLDERGAMNAERAPEVVRAGYYQPAILDAWRKGTDCEVIAKRFQLPPRVIRASIYLAQQAGIAGGIYAEARA